MLSRTRTTFFLLAAVGFLVVTTNRFAICDIHSNDDLGAIDPGPIDIDDIDIKPDDSGPKDTSAKEKTYTSPKIKPEGVFLYENFDDEQQFDKKWVRSKQPQYTGEWKLDSGPDRPHADLQLVIPNRARHYALSAKLAEPFKFSEDKPLIVQYEVQYRDGLDCGGAYVKLLRDSAIEDLANLTDKTPYSIMFGPDKCGTEAKLHFIVQYFNPKTQEYGEKHWKQAKYVNGLMATFADRKHHLYRLVLNPSNSFEIFLDGISAGKGNLLEDLDPPITPPKEIIDLKDKKPNDWDDRPQIDDPDAVKPDDWDESAPKTIPDPDATMPDDWLEDTPKYIPDPDAKKPDDWEEMDGEWEAPLIDNPACKGVSGCGAWNPPSIANPNYKGKWKPPKIDNPNYKGKWKHRKIPNPEYFYDEKPFSSLDPIGAVSFELWSMADNVAFDNILISNDLEPADLIKTLSWEEKKAEADATSESLLTRGMHYLKVYPWLWAVLILAVALPLFLFISYCCDTKKKRDTSETSNKKKPDEPEAEGSKKNKQD